MFGWSIIARAWRSASKRATTARVVHAWLDDLQGDAAADGRRLLGQEDRAKTAFADLVQQFVRPNLSARPFREFGGAVERFGQIQEVARFSVGA
jgi:hypothetical protein